MIDADTSEQTWVAFEASHPIANRQHGHAWVMSAEHISASATAKEAQLQDLNSLYPDAHIFASGLPQASTHSVPFKPTDLIPQHIDGIGQMNVSCLPALVQNQPFGLLAGGILRCDAYLSLNKNWDGVIFLPGQPNQWVLTSAEEIISFQSFSTETIVQSQWSESTPEIDESALTEALQDTLSRPETLAARLAELQSLYVLKRISAPQAYSRLWGVCLGAEFAAARPYWLGQNIAMIAAYDHATPYRIAFDSLAIPVTLADEKQMTLLGFMRAKQRADKLG